MNHLIQFFLSTDSAVNVQRAEAGYGNCFSFSLQALIISSHLPFSLLLLRMRMVAESFVRKKTTMLHNEKGFCELYRVMWTILIFSMQHFFSSLFIRIEFIIEKREYSFKGTVHKSRKMNLNPTKRFVSSKSSTFYLYHE